MQHSHNNKCKIIITDDNKVFIEGLKLLLSDYSEFEIIATYFNGYELLNSNLLSEADLLLIDIEMPQLNGIEAGIKINTLYPKLLMISLSMHLDKVYLSDIFAAGYKGFVYKPNVSKNLIEVIRLVLKKKFVFPDGFNIK